MTDEELSFYPWCYWDGAFTDKELNQIIEMCSKKELKKGVTVDPTKTDLFRSSKVNFHEYDETNKWIFERLNAVVREVNERYYNFDLRGYDFFQYSEYSSSTLDRYDFHIDLITGSKSTTSTDRFRKLSISLLLNEPYIDFEGGDLEISTSKQSDTEKVKTTKGRIILFPSFILHRVTPVTEGTRKSLVAWVQGPKFK